MLNPGNDLPHVSILEIIISKLGNSWIALAIMAITVVEATDDSECAISCFSSVWNATHHHPQHNAGTRARMVVRNRAHFIGLFHATPPTSSSNHRKTHLRST